MMIKNCKLLFFSVVNILAKKIIPRNFSILESDEYEDSFQKFN